MVRRGLAIGRGAAAVWLAALCVAAGTAVAEAAGTRAARLHTPPADDGLSKSLRREARAAVERGLQWLAENQNAGGWWSNKDFPALTALPLWAFARSDGKTDREHLVVIEKAVAHIRSCAQPDGAIFREATGRKGGGLANYNTAICMAALHALGDPALVPLVQKARSFLARNQHLESDANYGGMGYDPDTGRAYADLSNSYIAYEAMRLTQSVEALRKASGARVDLNWAAAAKFVESLQHRREGNAQPWVSDDPAHAGGFIYKPGHSQAGEATDKHDNPTLRAYGSMTYAGLLSFIYADVAPDDPRVQAAFDWALRHWTLEENPGIGQQGLYYYYHTLSKALAVYGQSRLTLPGGRSVNWRSELILKLLDLQRIDAKSGAGFWVNESGRWWEADPVLVTAYSILSVQHALAPNQ